MELENFYQGLQKDVSVVAKAFNTFSLEAYVSEVVKELIEIGDIEDFEFCENPKHAGAYIHGFNIETTNVSEGNEDISEGIKLNLFVTDYEQRQHLEAISFSELTTWFKRLLKFFKESYSNDFITKLDPSTEVYRIAEYIDVYKDRIEEVNLYF